MNEHITRIARSTLLYSQYIIRLLYECLTGCHLDPAGG